MRSQNMRFLRRLAGNGGHPLPLPLGEVAERSEDGEGIQGCMALSVTFGDSSPGGRAKRHEKWRVFFLSICSYSQKKQTPSPLSRRGCCCFLSLQLLKKALALGLAVFADGGFELTEQFLLLVDDDDPLAEAAGGDVVAHGHVSLRRQRLDLLTVSGRHARAEFDIFFHNR